MALLLGAGLVVAGPAVGAPRQPAFAGAEGHGAASSGGRGGRVIAVTQLGDAGPGSLRAALEAPGRRIVVFRVGGTIALESVIRVREPYLTVAGQTAPGGGILVRGAGDDALIRLERGVHDVVIRYLRLRNGTGSADGHGNDNLTVRNGSDIIIDHVSMSWATDENAGFYRKEGNPPLERLTIQRSILSEGIAGHSNGLMVGGTDDRRAPGALVEAWRQVRDISIHHNLFAHNTHRNPRVTAGSASAVNNVVYNWRTRIGSTTRGAVFDWVNNFSRVGPMRRADLDYVPRILMHHEHRHREGDAWPDPSIHTAGNIIEPDILVDPAADNWRIWKLNYSTPKHAPLPARFRRSAPLAPAPIPVTLQGARDAAASVLADVGANARLACDGTWVPNADAVDRRVIADVRAGTGPSRPVESPAVVGGYPDIAPGNACPDADGDGMFDEYERLHGLDPADPTDAASERGGVSALEAFLDGLPWTAAADR